MLADDAITTVLAQNTRLVDVLRSESRVLSGVLLR